MSSSLPGSEVSEINREAGVRPVPVSGDTFFVIQKGIEFERLTSGRFDISIGPIVKLWDIGGEKQRVPAADEIRDKLPLVGSAGIHLDGASGSVFLVKSGMMLDLGGIAKGYAADEAKKIIERSKVERAIVDIGGNIIVIGQKQGGRPWRIGVQNPFQSRGEYCGIVEMGEGTAVTSGTYERYFERDGKRYHHILDTATGYPVENSLMSVTIITKSSIKADALSTGVFALGLSDGMAMVEKLEGMEAIFVGRDRGVHLTSGIRDAFQLSDESFTLE